jgi:hypothetical protein
VPSVAELNVGLHLTPSLGTLALQAVSALAIALLSAWLTVKLSQRRFRAERLWDRRVVAYERVIEAFYKSKRFSSEHLDAQFSDREVPDERDEELRRLAQEAHEEIRRTADIGGFTLSAAALKVISDYEQEAKDPEWITMWHDHLEHDYKVTDKYLKLFIAEAKQDLEQ